LLSVDRLLAVTETAILSQESSSLARNSNGGEYILTLYAPVVPSDANVYIYVPEI
jgi:hypothetical protein